MISVWRRAYSERCQGLCGDVWQVHDVLGSGPISAAFWHPFCLLWVITVFMFLLSYVIFNMECKQAFSSDTWVYRRKFWWWRGLVVFVKTFFAGYGTFFVFIFLFGLIHPIYITAFAITLVSVLPALIPSIFVSSFIGVFAFNHFLGQRERLSATYAVDRIWAFVTISGTAAATFSILTFPN
jgi:hypothetical protein